MAQVGGFAQTCETKQSRAARPVFQAPGFSFRARPVQNNIVRKDDFKTYDVVLPQKVHVTSISEQTTCVGFSNPPSRLTKRLYHVTLDFTNGTRSVTWDENIFKIFEPILFLQK